MARGHRSGSVDSAMLAYCPERDGFKVPDFASLKEEVCQNNFQLVRVAVLIKVSFLGHSRGILN